MREMKESGIEWVGKIPINWNVMPNKRVMHKKKELCEKYNNEDILSLTMKGVIVRNLDAGGKIPASFDGYQIVYPNNLLMCLFDYDVTPRCIGLIKNKGLTSPAYSQFVMDRGNNSNYYYYYYLMIDNTKELLHLAKNLRHSFTEEQLGEIYTPVPPIEEQEKIANFLDNKISEIDNVIEKTKETIEDYKKYKQAIITEAITEGIEKNVEYKEINQNNLKHIPDNWNYKPLKYNVILNANSLSENTNEDYEFKYVEIGAVNISDGITEYQNCVFKNAPSRARRIVKEGDIIVSTVRTYLKAIAIIKDPNDTIVSTGFAVLEPQNINKDYLGWVIKSDYFTDMVSSRSNGISYPAINASDLVSFKIPVPDINNQNNIAEYLNRKCSEMDKLIKNKQKIIEELEQYRKSLIYEYVTGKKEVI